MQTKKTKILARIDRVMRRFGLTTEDLRAYAEQHASSLASDTPKASEDAGFDLLCKVNGQKVRVPFSSRNMGEPIAVFPFKDEPEYIELTEYHGVTHASAISKHLPSVKFFERVYTIKDQLNQCLQALDRPILKGAYLADNTHMPGCGWIVGFDNNKTGLSSDYYGGNRAAKLRYVGKFGA